MYHLRPRIPHGKGIKTQINITNNGQEVSLSPAGDQKPSINRYQSMTTPDINTTNVPKKRYRLGTVSKTILLEGPYQFHSANITLLKP